MLSNLATSLVNRGARKRHFRLSGGCASERALLSKGRPLLHETLLLGSRNALRTTEHAETQENRDLEASSWSRRAIFGPPGSIRRRVGRPTGRKAIYQAVWPLPQGQGRRPLLHGASLLGSRNALRTAEHAETQKIAIWRPRPGDPLSGHPTAFDDAWGGPFPEGASGPDFPGRPHEQEGHLPGWLAKMQGGSCLRGSHSLKGAEEGKAGLLRATWPRRAFCGPGKGQTGAVNPLAIPKRHPCEGGGEV